MSGIDIVGVLWSLAAIVQVHEGNRCPLVNRLLDIETPAARAAVVDLIEAAKFAERIFLDLRSDGIEYDFSCVTAAIAKASGGQP